MKTVPIEHLNKKVDGYLINSGFSSQGKEAIGKLQNIIIQELNHSIWCPPTETLHVTLMDWLAPLVKYEIPTAELFAKYYPQYHKALEEILKNQKPISIRFNEIKVSPKAIFIQGEDDGTYEKIRNNFLRQITLLPETKQPPRIIHSTIACFTDEINLESLNKFISSLSVDFVETINNFRLVNETETPMQKYNILKEYHLKRIEKVFYKP